MKFCDSIKFVPKVGEKRAGILYAELGVKSIGDMLMHFPYRYIDVRRFYLISELEDNMPYIQIKGYITAFEHKGKGRGSRLCAYFTDGSHTMELVWFAGEKFILNKYFTNTEYIVFGKPKRYGSRFTMAHPEIEIYEGINNRQDVGFKTLYHTTETMKKHYLSSSTIKGIVATILSDSDVHVPEVLPNKILQKYDLMPRQDAIVAIHLPRNQAMLTAAIRRLKFEELFFVQMSILRKYKLRVEHTDGFLMNQIGSLFNTFYKDILPFSLTEAQKRVVREIHADLKAGKQMNRLLQGDVGSGKTIVALLASLIALDNGFQASIMAPTEILATQHYKNISHLTERLGISVRLLIGSTRAKERKEIDSLLREGKIDILIGTHTLIEESVKFSNLGFVVIDEQHRFGVQQRAKLWAKNNKPPHILVMTATPIPRTLAMTLYSNLDVSVIDELPPGRKPILTYHYYDNKRSMLNAFLRQRIDNGCQVYVVYPLIQESEKLDIKNLEDGYLAMQEAFPDVEVDFLHGKMKPVEKDERMERFKQGKTKILMSTTVIEVGVDVPNASVMVIENAERFGLAQLHQLRGRVGRGSEQSYCLLMSNFKLSDYSFKRLQIMTETNNGFEIAESDLALRGPGEIEGTVQSGLPFNLKIANLAQDSNILQCARETAKEILEQDPTLSCEDNQMIASYLTLINKDNADWSEIS